jgi:hypothetical protein
MMLVVIAEVIATEQRREPAEAAAAGVVLVGKSGFLLPVRAIGAEVEELER